MFTFRYFALAVCTGSIVNLSACGNTALEQAQLHEVSPSSHQETENSKLEETDVFQYRLDSSDQIENQVLPVRPLILHKRINDYADQIAMSLMENAYSLNKTDKLAVASFVRFDHSLIQPTVLGNRLAESLITQLQAFGVTVIDTKLSDSMVITDHGDLVFSRDTAHLAQQLNIDYIVSGTLIERPRGVEVNARIIGVKHQNVAAASNLLIPSFIVANENGGVIDY